MNADVLVVDDESDICLQVSGILEDEGYKVVTAQNSDAALEALSVAHPKVVILDVWLERSRLDGLQLINEILEEAPQTVILMMSGHADIDTAVRAIRDGAYNFVEKPFSADRMIIAVARAYEAANLLKCTVSMNYIRYTVQRVKDQYNTPPAASPVEKYNPFVISL